MQPSPPHPDRHCRLPSSPDRIVMAEPCFAWTPGAHRHFRVGDSGVMRPAYGSRALPAGPSQCKSASARLHPASSGRLAGFYARVAARGLVGRLRMSPGSGAPNSGAPSTITNETCGLFRRPFPAPSPRQVFPARQRGREPAPNLQARSAMAAAWEVWRNGNGPQVGDLQGRR
jgi:hypothetical protein